MSRVNRTDYSKTAMRNSSSSRLSSHAWREQSRKPAFSSETKAHQQQEPLTLLDLALATVAILLGGRVQLKLALRLRDASSTSR